MPLQQQQQQQPKGDTTQPALRYMALYGSCPALLSCPLLLPLRPCHV